MNKKIYLISGILTSIVFISMLIEMIGIIYNGNSSQIKFKEILYLIGWLTMSIFTLSQYFSQK